MTFTNPGSPNLPDFQTFVYGIMQINPLVLPEDSPVFGYALGRAQSLVIRAPGPCGSDYTDAVYNCAAHILVRSAQDQEGRTFFVDLRKQCELHVLAAGLVASTGDAGTSVSLAVPDAMAQLTISDLGFMKTPWGRAYLEFNQDFGGVWGLS